MRSGNKGKYVDGKVQVMVTQRGSVFYDVTKIKGLPVNGGQTDNTSAAASGNPSIDIIDEKTSAVNSKYAQ